MREPFCPQLALFVAGRPLLALYREFIFPSVPVRTGLLAVGIDDVRAANPENIPIALDIALSRAAVVVYDAGGRARLPLDYVLMRRADRPLVVVAAPGVDAAEPPADAPEASAPTVGRPAEMSGWPQTFVEPLLDRIGAAAALPGPAEIGGELTRLEEGQDWSNLVLTGLALLERRMRMEDLPTAVPLNPTGGVMQRLQEYFGGDFPAVISAVSLRHGLLQNQQADAAELRQTATSIAQLVRDRYAVPVPGQATPAVVMSVTGRAPSSGARGESGRPGRSPRPRKP